MKRRVFIILVFIIAVFACGFSPAERAGTEREEYILPIIMYHSTYRKNTGKFTVSPAELRQDLIYLKNNGFTTITVCDLVRFKEEGTPLPAKPIMLTFDDGYKNNFLFAYPLFKEFNMKCVMSVVGTLTDRNYREQVHAEEGGHLNYEQIKEMADSGLVEIQNHTYNLHRINRRYGLKKMKGEGVDAYKALIKKDLLMLHDSVKERTGVTMNAVAFPFGGYSREAIEVLKEIGYKAAFTCTEGINIIHRDSDLFELKRYNRPSGLASSQFFNKVLVKSSKK